MIDAALLSHCRNLAHSGSRRAGERPLYVVDGSIFDGLEIRRDVLAWPTPGGNGLRDCASDIGSDWKGTGAAHLSFRRRDRRKCKPEYFRDGVLNTLIHETGTSLAAIAADPEDDLADLFDVPRFASGRHERESRPTHSRPEPGSAEDFHGEIRRIATHLWAVPVVRMEHPAAGLYGSACITLVQPPHFVATLLREIVEMRDATFAEILAHDPPEAFTELWSDCLETFATSDSASRKETRP